MRPRAVTIRRQVELRTWKGRSLCSDTYLTQLRGYQLPLLTSKATGFDRFDSNFGRNGRISAAKKLRTAETGFGFRLSEVIPYLGERGAAFGGLQGVELENGFYPYSGWNSRNAPSAAVM